MSTSKTAHINLNYQDAVSPLGGSYTQNKLAKLRLPPLSGKKFLDLGCNAGFYCKYALDNGASRVVGVDLDKKVIAQAREKHPQITFFDTGWDVFPDETFDVIICLSAIHYAKNPVALVEKIWNHLNPGGVFVLEGGLIDAEQKYKTDTLIPSWREVGDRCRHLSTGFVRSHLLRQFDWKIIGPSEPRGGDAVPRYVVHAVRGAGEKNPPPTFFQVDVIEFAQCLALSAKTIVEKMPSYSYVKALGNMPQINKESVEALLSDNANFSNFACDLLFALDGQSHRAIKFYNSVSPSLLQSLAAALAAKNVAVQF